MYTTSCAYAVTVSYCLGILTCIVIYMYFNIKSNNMPNISINTLTDKMDDMASNINDIVYQLEKTGRCSKIPSKSKKNL
jgi:hypothetical protein